MYYLSYFTICHHVVSTGHVVWNTSNCKRGRMACVVEFNSIYPQIIIAYMLNVFQAIMPFESSFIIVYLYNFLTHFISQIALLEAETSPKNILYAYWTTRLGNVYNILSYVQSSTQ